MIVKKKHPLDVVMDVLGSYGLACVLLLLLFVLTFLGTIEQTEHGLYEVQKRYFESLFVVYDVGGVLPVPLPGVYLVLILLTLNLLVGGIVRLRKNRSTFGVLVIHLGIALMLAAGFVKLKLSDDGNLQLFEGGRNDEYQSYYEWEIAIWDAAQTGPVSERLIPESDFADLAGDAKRTFEAADLPFKLELTNFLKNCAVVPKGPKFTAPNPVIDGYTLLPVELQKEAEHNVAGLYVRVIDGGPGKDGILHAFASHPFLVAAGGKTWAVDLRHKRYRMPYVIQLDKFIHETHPGTRMDKAFLSEITKIENGVPQQIKIQMNEPLRSGGLVLFQSGWGPQDARPGDRLYSVFAVVRNPSDQWPLISCIIIGLGMAITFGQKLAKYMKAQAAENARLALEPKPGAVSSAASRSEPAKPDAAKPDAPQSEPAAPEAAKPDSPVVIAAATATSSPSTEPSKPETPSEKAAP